MAVQIQTEIECFWYLNLSETQQEAYDTFYAHLKEEGHLLAGHDDPFTLMRFLKARQWEPPKATLMYNAMVAWRQTVDAEGIDASFEFNELPNIMPVYPHFYHKVDKYGRPVYYELLGKTDCHKMLEISTEKRILEYHIWAWERFERRLLPACSTLNDKPVIAAIVIIDLTGLSFMSFGSATRHLLHLIAKIDQDYYPEHLGQMYIINTPFIFKTMWVVVYPLLEERTRKKIHVIGADYAKTLLGTIPEENLPVKYGGTSKLNENYLVCEGPWEDAEVMKSRPWLPYKDQPSK